MARIDYIKVRFAVPLSEDRGIQVQRFEDHKGIAAASVAEAGEGNFKTSKDYSTREGWVLNYLEIWGLASHLYTVNTIELIAHVEVMRIDIREQLVSGTKIDKTGELASKGGRRQYQYFNQRVREKSDDRSGGGMGWAKGSHKSEKRISVYKRGQEQPAAELQLRGDKAQQFYAEVKALRKEIPFISDGGEIVYTADLFDRVGITWLNADLHQECNLTVNQLNATAELPTLDETETRLAALDALWDMMDAESRKAFLQAKIWGDEDDAFVVA
jgi:hypothetical protein